MLLTVLLNLRIERYTSFLSKGNMQKCVPVSHRFSDISHDPVFMHSVSRMRKHRQAREKKNYSRIVGDTRLVTPRAKVFLTCLGGFFYLTFERYLGK